MGLQPILLLRSNRSVDDILMYKNLINASTGDLF